MARPNPHPAISDVPRAAPSGSSARRSVAASLLISLRPAQWTKNLIVFAGLVFSMKLFEPASVVVAGKAFAIFCALSGVVYLINDVMDRESDRLHPLKRRRPIAAGDLSVPAAVTAAIALGAGA